jgi:capsular exopolysaccharide synthesis family protein
MSEYPHLMPAAPAVETASFDAALRQVLRAGRRNKRLFLACFGVISLVGFTTLAVLPPTYRATVTVALATANQIPTDGAPIADPTQEDDWPLTVASMMQSSDVAAAALAAVPQPTPRPSLRKRLCALGLHVICPAPLSPSELKAAQIYAFLKNLTVMPEPHSRVIDVTVEGADPVRVANLANAVVQAYQQVSLTRQSADADRMADWLNQRTATLKQSWLAARDQADDFTASHHLTIVTTATSSEPLVQQQVATVAANLAVAQAQLDSAQSQDGTLHDAALSGDASAVVAMPAQPMLASTADTLIQLENARDQLAAEFGPNYPKIRALDLQIAHTKATLNGQTGSALSSIRGNLASARRDVRQLSARLDALRAEAVNEAPEDAEYAVLSARAASLGAEYQTFLQHANDAMDRSLYLQPPVSVVSAADVPLSPAAPNKLKFGLGTLFLAFVAGTVAVLAKDRATQGFAQAEELRASVQLPLLATLPLLPNLFGTVARHVVEDPYSRTSEAMRGLAASLAMRAGDHERSQTILVTSAGALEGKSTIATWLALTMQKSGQNVLLVDGDHRRGTLMRDVSLHYVAGLTDVLAGEATIGEVVQSDPDTGLAFITAGSASARSFGTVDIAQLRRLLEGLKQNYSMIVIDSPPLLAMVDGLVLGSLADQTVFVCRWQFSSRQSITASLERLRSYGARVAGLVVSMVDQEATLDFNGEYSRREFRLINQLYGS